MRHLFDLASIEVLLVPRAVIRLTGLASLIAATGLANGFTPRNCGARPTAVPMTVVACRAQEEDLAAPTAGHKSERFDVRVRPIF